MPEEGNTEDILKSADYDINDILGLYFDYTQTISTN